jgi:ribonuclease III
VNPDRVAALGEKLGHRFDDAALLERALTHTSYANEHPPTAHNESLALLGDAALSLVVVEHLYASAPAATVGMLTPGRAELVSDANLARWAAALDLGELVRLGRGEEQTGGRARPSILATTFEAVLGVIHLEAGLEAVRTAVRRVAVW